MATVATTAGIAMAAHRARLAQLKRARGKGCRRTSAAVRGPEGPTMAVNVATKSVGTDRAGVSPTLRPSTEYLGLEFPAGGAAGHMGVEVAAANRNFLAVQAGRDRFTGFVAPN